MDMAVIKDFIVACAAAFGGFVAWQGLSTWNRQLTGSAGFEAARALARATYRVREAMWRCRAPLLMGAEFPKSYVMNPRRSPKDEADGLAYVYEHRWQLVYEALQEFDAATLEAEALWGAEIRSRTNELRECLYKLRAAISAVVDNADSGGEHFKADPKFAIECRQRVAASQTAKNPLSDETHSAIGRIEDILRPHLRRE